jgi:hypothetical protein
MIISGEVKHLVQLALAHNSCDRQRDGYSASASTISSSWSIVDTPE